MRAFIIALLCLVPISIYASARASSGGLAERVAELEAEVDELSAILQFVYVEMEEVNGLAGPHWIIEGANVHVRSGQGTTWEGCSSREPDWPNCESLTGRGNLIIGYNEQFRPPPAPTEDRTGSHNLIVGQYHSFSSFSGFVAGMDNAVTGWAASVCGGVGNEASGSHSSVSGGHRNLASGNRASVSGGQDREAPDENNWVAGALFEEN